ncbi:hypothetical protein CbuD7D7780_01735 [Coxiella burnetii]|uniref:Uncharacterized protein n=1 Tax=Coxiella burnetii (strain Dugway 5J108-111) TaxID=434922 RepID=A9KDI3_COXBN|nr:CBU_1665 family Dot/Icm T4SS effector [Coxiella burnetii]ABS76507.1 hypothetical protein CBUD_0334 [Coxiella burnetii Dugway 5J108-111]OYK80903.1 hypothetical protein CbuD7E6568_01715 [Coxiella burnetii]OYK82991.1 hypothetical protein CbuD7D7780_01735 [Coxiella burnetii]
MKNKIVLRQLLAAKSIIPVGIYAGPRLDDSTLRNVKTYQALIAMLNNGLPLDGSELNCLITKLGDLRAFDLCCDLYYRVSPSLDTFVRMIRAAAKAGSFNAGEIIYNHALGWLSQFNYDPLYYSELVNARLFFLQKIGTAEAVKEAIHFFLSSLKRGWCDIKAYPAVVGAVKQSFGSGYMDPFYQEIQGIFFNGIILLDKIDNAEISTGVTREESQSIRIDLLNKMLEAASWNRDFERVDECFAELEKINGDDYRTYRNLMYTRAIQYRYELPEKVDDEISKVFGKAYERGWLVPYTINSFFKALKSYVEQGNISKEGKETCFSHAKAVFEQAERISNCDEWTEYWFIELAVICGHEEVRLPLIEKMINSNKDHVFKRWLGNIEVNPRHCMESVRFTDFVNDQFWKAKNNKAELFNLIHHYLAHGKKAVNIKVIYSLIGRLGNFKYYLAEFLFLKVKNDPKHRYNQRLWEAIIKVAVQKRANLNLDILITNLIETVQTSPRNFQGKAVRLGENLCRVLKAHYAHNPDAEDPQLLSKLYECIGERRVSMDDLNRAYSNLGFFHQRLPAYPREEYKHEFSL